MSGLAPPHYEVIVIGGGQAGLAAAYHLAKAGIPYLILDAHQRTGDSWRQRWEGLQLFSPQRYNRLPGTPPTRAPSTYPTALNWPTTSRRMPPITDYG